MTVDTHKPRIDRWPLPDNVINPGVLPARHPALQVLAAHRQREYWQATGETMPEIVDDMMAGLRVAGGGGGRGAGRDEPGDRRRYEGGARCRGRERAPAIEPLVPFGGRAKLPAERAERAETSNPSEIEAFSTMARRGGNRRKPPAETLLGQPAAFFCLTLGVHSSSQYRHRLRKLR